MFKDNATLGLIGTIMVVGVMIACVAALIPARPQAAPAANVVPPPVGQSSQSAAPADDQSGAAPAPDTAVPPTAVPVEDSGLVEAPVEPTDLTVRLPALSVDLAAYGSPPPNFNGDGDLLPSVPDGTTLHVVAVVARVEGGRITMRLLKVELAPGVFFYVPFMRDGEVVVMGTTMASFDALVLAQLGQP